MHGEQDLVDGLANRQVVADQKDSRHGLTGPDSGISVRRNRSAIMSEENSALCGSPLQNRRVGRCRQVYIPNVQKVQARIAQS